VEYTISSTGANVYQEYSLDFIKSGSAIEYRAYSYGLADISIDHVVITPKKVAPTTITVQEKSNATYTYDIL